MRTGKNTLEIDQWREWRLKEQKMTWGEKEGATCYAVRAMSSLMVAF
jgi:hypothetical protein